MSDKSNGGGVAIGGVIFAIMLLSPLTPHEWRQDDKLSALKARVAELEKQVAELKYPTPTTEPTLQATK